MTKIGIILCLFAGAFLMLAKAWALVRAARRNNPFKP